MIASTQICKRRLNSLDNAAPVRLEAAVVLGRELSLRSAHLQGGTYGRLEDEGDMEADGGEGGGSSGGGGGDHGDHFDFGEIAVHQVPKFCKPSDRVILDAAGLAARSGLRLVVQRQPCTGCMCRIMKGTTSSGS